MSMTRGKLTFLMTSCRESRVGQINQLKCNHCSLLNIQFAQVCAYVYVSTVCVMEFEIVFSLASSSSSSGSQRFKNFATSSIKLHYTNTHLFVNYKHCRLSLL